MLHSHVSVTPSCYSLLQERLREFFPCILYLQVESNVISLYTGGD